jgi:DNA-binding GntR family transcriptional regulator
MPSELAPASASKAASPRIRDRLIVSLRGLIVSAELKSGQKLNEANLARRLKTSRTPLREALLHLERESLVRSDLRRGFSVEPLSAREVRETYPMLSALESHAVRSTLDFVPTLIPKLKQINAAFERARSAEQALKLDTLWHDTLMSHSSNSRLKALVANFRRAIERYERIYMADVRLILISARQHESILTAFHEGKADAALKSLEENYAFGMRALLKKMGED